MIMLPAFLDFIQTIYGQFAIIAAAVGVIWGFIKAVGAAKDWIRRLHDDRVRKAQNEQKMMRLVETMDGKLADIKQRFSEIDKRFEKLDRQYDKTQNDIVRLSDAVAEVRIDIRNNNDATATLMLDEMMESYHVYVLQHEPIPLSVQTALCEMYDKYKVYEWHNHVPENFKQKIMECDVIGG